MKWFEEDLYKTDIQLRLQIEDVLFLKKTEHFELMIFKNPLMGNVLTLDGVIQTTEKDEFFYHEMMTHVPFYAHGNVKNVCVVGGGDGGIIRELVKHSSIESITLVEISEEVISLSKQYLPSLSDHAFEDPRVKVVIQDGALFAKECNQQFDLMIIDSTDPIGPGKVLFQRQFYEACKKCLTNNGLLITQNGVPLFQQEELESSLSIFSELFGDATCYITPVPTYFGSFMALGWATDNRDYSRHSQQVIEERFLRNPISTKYYNPKAHIGAFLLPNYIERLIPQCVS